MDVNILFGVCQEPGLAQFAVTTHVSNDLTELISMKTSSKVRVPRVKLWPFRSESCVSRWGVISKAYKNLVFSLETYYKWLHTIKRAESAE